LIRQIIRNPVAAVCVQLDAFTLHGPGGSETKPLIRQIIRNPVADACLAPDRESPDSPPMIRCLQVSCLCSARCVHSSWAGRFGDRPSLVTPTPAICHALSGHARPRDILRVRSDIRMSRLRGACGMCLIGIALHYAGPVINCTRVTGSGFISVRAPTLAAGMLI
jgi:hypothetical protein